MKREKIDERFFFTEEERWKILEKTGQKCAHCGKPIFAIEGIEHSMTVDHFIPLSKGGTNRMINLIPMCKECNKEKDDMIVNPEGYLPYLKEKYLKEIKGYHDSYIHSFNYLSTKNLLAEDEFNVTVPYYPLKGFMRKSGPAHEFSYQVKKVRYDDLDEVYDYYMKYLDKYEELKSIDKAYDDILQWFENGCMYYVKKNEKIMILVAFDILLLDTKSYFGPVIEIWPFAYYNKQEVGTLMSKIVLSVPLKIIHDCNLPALPVLTSVLCHDHIYDHLSNFSELFGRKATNGITCKGFNIVKESPNGIVVCSPKVLTTNERKKIDDFMSNFRFRQYSVDDVPPEEIEAV